MSIRKLRSARVNSVTANQYIGQEGDMFWDEDTGTLRVSDGHTPGGYYPVLTAPIAAFGDFTAVTNTLSTINNNESINLVTQGTGALNLYGGGGLNIHTDGTGSNVAMSVLPTGVTNIFSPTVSNTTNAVTINGTSTNQLRPTVFRGTMLNVTGNDNQINTVTLDAIGTFTSANTGVTSTFARIVGRAGRGTITTPTALQTNDEMLRFTGTGYSGQPSLSGYTVGAAIRFLASENYTPTAAGSRIEFSANPIGSITPGGMGTLMLTVDGQGISTPGNLTANGTATLNGTTNFVGPTNFYGLITSYGNRISNGDSIFNGNLTVANGLTVEGNTTHQGNLVINGNAIVSNQVNR
jgi:hypothetical protein